MRDCETAGKPQEGGPEQSHRELEAHGIAERSRDRAFAWLGPDPVQEQTTESLWGRKGDHGRQAPGRVKKAHHLLTEIPLDRANEVVTRNGMTGGPDDFDDANVDEIQEEIQEGYGDTGGKEAVEVTAKAGESPWGGRGELERARAPLAGSKPCEGGQAGVGPKPWGETRRELPREVSSKGRRGQRAERRSTRPPKDTEEKEPVPREGPKTWGGIQTESDEKKA